MDTDIDKWDTISFEKPEKDEDDWYWDFYPFECNSLIDFIERFEGKFSEFENMEQTLVKIYKQLYEGVNDNESQICKN